MNAKVEHITWLGHASFRIEADGLVVYIDPWQLEGGPEADIILITHDHDDHCSSEDVAKIQKDETVIVTIEAAAQKLEGQIEIVKPGDTLKVKDVSIETVPAYNLTKFRSPGVPYHPKEAEHVGFVITLDGQRIYHTGDADVIPEMESIKTDIALLPVSGTYVMTAEEAVEAAGIIQPKVAIPMHIGRGIGSMDAAEEFRNACPVPVVILPISS